MCSREHFQVWTQAVSSTSSVNRVAVSSTHSHPTVTLSSFFRLESNTPVQALVRFLSPAVCAPAPAQTEACAASAKGLQTSSSYSRSSSFQSRGRSPPSDSSPSHRNFMAFHRLSCEESSSLPLLSCFGEQNTPHPADKSPSISAPSFGNEQNKNYLPRSPFPVFWTISYQ